MTVLSVITAPPSAPQVQPEAQPALIPQSVLDPVEQPILQAVRSSEPIHIWRLLNRLVQEESLPSRRAVRERQLELCRLVNSLLGCRVLVRAGRHAVTTKPSPALATSRCRA